MPGQRNDRPHGIRLCGRGAVGHHHDYQKCYSGRGLNGTPLTTHRWRITFVCPWTELRLIALKSLSEIFSPPVEARASLARFMMATGSNSVARGDNEVGEFMYFQDRYLTDEQRMMRDTTRQY